MYWKAGVMLVALMLCGCVGHTLVGTTYKVQAGRSVNELFHDGTTAWQAGAEFRFDVRR